MTEATDVDARPEQKKATHFAFIDGLRAVAVLAVIAYHVNDRLLPGGFVGVDMFFVVSGFVVSGSVVGFTERRPHSFVLRFAARRARRILPALVVCLCVTQALTLVLIPDSGLSAGTEAVGLRALFGISNRLLSVGTDYFSAGADFNPFTHTWSLGVEEQFYVLFPLVFLAWLASGWWRRLSVAVVGGTLIYSLLHARTLTVGGSRTFAFFATSTRLWQIAAGVALYQFVARGERDPAAGVVPRRWRGSLLAVSLALLAAALVGARPDHVPWPDGILVVAGTVGVLAALIDRDWDNPVTRALASRPLVTVGLLSYSLYLWHWPVLVLFRWTVGLGSSRNTIAALVLVVALAITSYRFVERPIRQGRWITRRPAWLIVAVAGAVLAATYVGTSEAIARKSQLSASVVVQDRDTWQPGGTDARSPVPGCAIRSRTDAPSGALVFEPVGCPGYPAQALFVAGDSHAGAYGLMLRQFALDTGSPVHVLSNPGCGFALVPPENFESTACQTGARRIMRYVERVGRAGDGLFLPSLRQARLSSQERREDVAAVVRSPGSVIAASDKSVAVTTRLLRPLVARGIKLLFPAPLPLFAAPPFRCADDFNKMNPICAPGFVMARALLERYRAPVVAAMEELAATLPAQVWDPLPTLCEPSKCRAFQDGKPLFFDGDHLTGLGNRLLVPSFEAAVAQLLA